MSWPLALVLITLMLSTAAVLVAAILSPTSPARPPARGPKLGYTREGQR